MKNSEKQEKENILKEENHSYSNKKEGEMAKKKPKDKTIMAVVGVLLTLFGVIGTIPVLQNRHTFGW